MEELKPCPFCGSDAKLVKDDQGGIYAECTSEHCGCSLDYAARDNETMRAHIIEQWNTRAERTCSLVEDCDGYSTCSECGESFIMSYASYCPSCGAKAVSE